MIALKSKTVFSRTQQEHHLERPPERTLKLYKQAIKYGVKHASLTATAIGVAT